MKLEIYGVPKGELNLDNWGKKTGQYLGSYDGVKFSSDKYQLKDLEEFDYLHIFINGRIKQHSPKRFNKNILKKLENTYAREFGECIQTTLL